MFFVVLITLLLTIIAWIYYRKSTANAQYFRDQNVKYKDFSFSAKMFYSVFFGRIDVWEFTQQNYNAIPDVP